MSLDDFKEIKKAEAVEVKQNPQTGKFFFICGDATGAVSHKFTTQGGEAVISQVEAEDAAGEAVSYGFRMSMTVV